MVAAFAHMTNGAPAEYGDFPLRAFLDMTLTSDDAGTGVAIVEAGPDHMNPNGVVHGSVLFALVNTTVGKATMSMIDEPDTYCASIEVSMRFIGPALDGPLTATASVIKRGRNVVHLESRVADGDDRLVATSAGSFAILRP
jgi:uncharacterized protein (TIGR00369 family)